MYPSEAELKVLLDDIRNNRKEELYISHYWDKASLYPKIAEVLSANVSLTTVNLNFSQTSLEDIRVLFEVLSRHSTIRRVTLTGIVNPVLELCNILREYLARNPLAEVLSLERSMIRDLGAKAIAVGLEKNTHLKELDLRSNGVVADGMDAIGNTLTVNTSLEVLNLDYNTARDVNIIALMNGLAPNKTLKELKLGHNDITPKGMDAISECIKINEGLRAISIDGFFIFGEGGLARFADGIGSNNTLTHLVLHGNQQSFSPEEFKRLVDALEKNTALKSLVLFQMRILSSTVDYLVMLLAGLSNNTTMEHLDFSYSYSWDNPVLANALREFVEKNRSLRALTIKSSNLSNDFFDSLGAGLERNPGIEVLSLSLNRPDVTGMRSFSKGLAGRSRVRELDLEHCRMDAAQMAELAPAFQDNSTLMRVSLEGNKIENEGVESLASHFTDKTALCELNLAKNNIGIKGAESIKTILVKSRYLFSLNLNGNPLTPQAMMHLAHGLADNFTVTDIDINESKTKASDNFRLKVNKAVDRNQQLSKNLYSAWSRGDDLSINALLDRGVSTCSLHARDPATGDTILHAAVRANDRVLINKLKERLDFGFLLHIKNARGETAQDIAKLNGMGNLENRQQNVHEGSSSQARPEPPSSRKRAKNT